MGLSNLLGDPLYLLTRPILLKDKVTGEKTSLVMYSGRACRHPATFAALQIQKQQNDNTRMNICNFTEI